MFLLEGALVPEIKGQNIDDDQTGNGLREIEEEVHGVPWMEWMPA
jgi:hypothetical protein